MAGLLAPVLAGCASKEPDTLRAAVIDQVAILEHNDSVIGEVTASLQRDGFKVDLFQGDKVDIDLYRRLPSLGYQVIVFRTHSGRYSGAGGVAQKGTYLLSGEPYQRSRYTSEQLKGQLISASITPDSSRVFAINDSFISESMKGQFKGTTVLLMGCSSLRQDDLAQAFLLKGVAAVIGWDASVNLEHNDRAIARLVASLCDNDLTIAESVDYTMQQVGPDPDFFAVLRFLPAEIGGLTLRGTEVCCPN